MKNVLRKIGIPIIKTVLFTVVLIFVGKTLWTELQQISWNNLQVNPYFIILTLMFELLTRILGGFLYHFLLQALGYPLPVFIAGSINWLSSLGRYVPGKITLIGSAAYLLSRYQVRYAIAAVIPIMANLMTIFVAVLLSMPLLFLGFMKDFNLLFHVMAFLFLGTSLIAWKPNIILKIYNNVLIHLGYAKINLRVNWVQVLTGLGLVLGQCLCGGIATWCMINAFAPLDISMLPYLVSVTVFAGTIGLLALFSPAGLGVRDGAYLLLLTTITGAGVAALITVFLRIMQTLSDLLMAILAVFLLWFVKNR